MLLFIALFVCKQKASFLCATPSYLASLKSTGKTTEERREGWRGRLVVSGELGVISNSLPANALSSFPPFVIFVSREGFSLAFSLTGLVSHSLGHDLASCLAELTSESRRALIKGELK